MSERESREPELVFIQALGLDMDFRQDLTEFESRGSALRAFYHTVIIEDQDRGLIDWLKYIG
jgi:hypothetical protein